jgi:hypothetical protein
MMTPPTIGEAKKLAYDLRAKGVIILAFENGKVNGASYGHSRPLCDAMGKVLDQIVDLIGDGGIVVPDNV